MKLKERVKKSIAVVGTVVPIVSGGMNIGAQLIDDPGAGLPAVSCSAALERVVELMEEHPEVADLYAQEGEYLPSVFSEEEVEACGDPRHLVGEIGNEDGADAEGEASRGNDGVEGGGKEGPG